MTSLRRGLTRRRLFGLAGGSGAALGLAAATTGCGLDLSTGLTGDILNSRRSAPAAFRTPLPIPPVKEPSRVDGTTDYYEIVQREASVRILPDLDTPILGYDGIFPGPTIVSRSGRRTVVRHRNELTVPTAVHLHGGHTPPEHDGFPIDLVFPTGADPESWPPPELREQAPPRDDEHGNHRRVLGDVSEGEREYVYPVDQRATTLWYHDHRADFTGPQVYRGLAGFHLIHDDEEESLPLPAGDKDIPLMIVDRSFTEDGELAYPSLDPTLSVTPGVESDYMEGVLGDVILVNGAPWPVLEVDAVRYRFRILNAANARRFRFALDPPPSEGASFVQVGGDGGLLERPVDHDKLVAAPAERFDVVIDFSGYSVGTEVTLINELGGSTGTSNVMRFRVARKAKDESAVPDRLSRIERLDPATAVRTREWRFSRMPIEAHGLPGWGINGEPFNPGKPQAEARLGETEIWRFVSDLHHPVHVHLDPFQVIGRKGRDPGPFDRGWKDTVDIHPAEYVDVAVRFGTYSGMYVMHCHNLEHEDMMMMAAFRTVE